MDLVWDGYRLVVAGPDTRARWHESPPGAGYVALRFSGGTGPALLGVTAVELRDVSPGLEELWPAARARVLTERVAADPVAALEAWALGAAAACAVDPLGPAVLQMAGAGVAAAEMADRLGLGPRRLHRRCLALFGYGPQHLLRVLRLNRALAGCRTGLALGQVAYACGYADQSHLSREVRDLTGATPASLVRELGLR